MDVNGFVATERHREKVDTREEKTEKKKKLHVSDWDTHKNYFLLCSIRSGAEVASDVFIMSICWSARPTACGKWKARITK